MKSLVEKYDKQAPRYTSYPPVPFWQNPPSNEEWIGHLKKNYQADVGVDLYLHIPFCQQLCYYCGCHKIITKNLDRQNDYVEALITEWQMYRNLLPDLKIHSIHFGGGTPTFLHAEKIDELMEALDPKGMQIGSVEVDPRTTNEEHLKVFMKWKLDRISMGIQDFTPHG